VLSLHLLYGCRVAEGGRSLAPVTGDGNGEGEVMGAIVLEG
jgi:hypothetical protein